eukprot:SAG22_NODE_3519_length_1666_cov_1.324186_2_plen_219_part_00
MRVALLPTWRTVLTTGCRDDCCCAAHHWQGDITVAELMRHEGGLAALDRSMPIEAITRCGNGPLFKGSDHCLSFCFSAFPCGSTALTSDRCSQRRDQGGQGGGDHCGAAAALEERLDGRGQPAGVPRGLAGLDCKRARPESRPPRCGIGVRVQLPCVSCPCPGVMGDGWHRRPPPSLPGPIPLASTAVINTAATGADTGCHWRACLQAGRLASSCMPK